METEVCSHCGILYEWKEGQKFNYCPECYELIEETSFVSEFNF